MNRLQMILILAGLLGSGLVAGLFFTFSTFVMQALAKLSPAQGIEAMQWINRTVMNRLTMGVFIGTAVLGLVIPAAHGWQPQNQGWWLLILGGALYVFGAFGITAACNVPMNERLAGMPAEDRQTAEYWSIYQSRWLFWNHVRAVMASAATVTYALALWSIG